MCLCKKNESYANRDKEYYLEKEMIKKALEPNARVKDDLIRIHMRNLKIEMKSVRLSQLMLNIAVLSLPLALMGKNHH